MENVLSQNEVNALLNAINQGGVEESGDRSEIDAKPFDLTSHDRIVRGRMPALDMINERLARLLRSRLSNAFRKNFEVSYGSAELVKYSDFVASVSVPACLCLFKAPPLKSTSLVSVEAGLIFGLVEQVFGGYGALAAVEGREYSAIEVRLIRQMVDLVLPELAKAWAPVIPIAPEYQRTEVNPQFATVAAPTDMVMNQTLQVELEGMAKGAISIMIPYAALERFRALLSSALRTDGEDDGDSWSDSINQTLRTIDVDFCAMLGTGQLSLRELMKLKVGDTVCLDSEPAEPLSCLVEGYRKAGGFPVTSRGRLAVRLTREVGGASASPKKETP